MTTFARWAARSSVVAGLAGAAANALLLAFLILLFVRPGPTQLTVGSVAGVLGAISSVFLAPVAVALGGTALAALGVIASVVLAAAWLLFATGVLTLQFGAPVVSAAGLLLALWLVLVCGEDTVPPRASRFGSRCGTVALVGTLVVVGALTLLPFLSTTQLVVLAVGGTPGVLAWLAVPAWSLRMGRVLGVLYAADADAHRTARPG